MNRFCAKVLLFGEYSVVKGGKGLALPFHEYFGTLVQDCHSLGEENNLGPFCEFLSNSSILASTLDLEKLHSDVTSGLGFNSSIPQGAGVGSSGALCAAIYSSYQKDDINLEKRSMAEILDHMALMESFYHGSSSGLDPLISLVQKPAVVSNRNKIEFLPSGEREMPELFLVDTGKSRKTAPLVHQFLKMLEGKSFSSGFQEFVELSDGLILSLLKSDMKEFDDLFHKLSRWQYLNLKPMICPNIDELWLKGLETKEFYVKLCGAGGGGHYILYKRDAKTLPSNLLKIKF